MARLNVNPTRMELSKLKKKLVSAQRGHKLLKDKRDELMRQFMGLIKENRQLRTEVEAAISEAGKYMAVAGSVMQKEVLETALMMPKQEVELEVGEKNVMSVYIPVFSPKFKTGDSSGVYSYGTAFTSTDLDGAVSALSEVFPKMIRLAEIEKACQLMADEIEKNPGDDLLSGSYIISGECQAHLTAVGRDFYISKLSMEATRQKKGDDKSQMVRSLDKLVMVIGVLIIPIGGILLYQQMMIQHLPFRESVIAMVAAILGMIPEGLYMMASIAMVVSAMRLARTEVLVQNMRCIETLARVDVLCVDKTGTITGNDMHVTEVRPMMRESTLPGCTR